MSNFVNLLDVVYPVGSIYMSMDSNANPASVVGGTWAQVTNRFLCASSSVMSTGGYEYSYMDLCIDYYYGVLSGADRTRLATFSGGASATYTELTQSKAYEISSYLIGLLDERTPNQLKTAVTWDNKPPYITCKMWYRTA